MEASGEAELILLGIEEKPGMAHYFIYLLDQARHLDGIVAFTCAADAEALEYAQQLVGDDGEVELWVRGQCPEISVSDGRNPRFIPTAAVVRRGDDRPPDADLLEDYRKLDNVLVIDAPTCPS